MGYRDDSEGLRKRAEAIEKERRRRQKEDALDAALARAANERAHRELEAERGHSPAAREVKERKDRFARIAGALSALLGLALMGGAIALVVTAHLPLRTVLCAATPGALALYWGIRRLLEGAEKDD
ncbi:MAG: hypothetical protein IT378_15425 [Sandaracinaceae bacterium]|nr:hypothetical protein [Sandaracinaceae bacterium]